MTSISKRFKLKMVGICGHCKQVVEIEDGPCHSRPSHRYQGLPCRGSHYSIRDVQFVIETPEQAAAVAHFLLHDRHEECLARPGHGHSMQCADGRHCRDQRQMLTRALAAHYLEQFPIAVDAAIAA